MWYFLAFFCGVLLGALVMAIVAMGKCAECETINRILNGGK